MVLESLLWRSLERARARGNVSLRIELWNGQKFEFCREPRVTITIPNAWALRYFVAPDLGRLGEAFVEGYIGVQGTAKDVFAVAEALAQEVTRGAFPKLHSKTSHSRHRDRQSIQYHYDVSDDFYSLFLDPDMVYSCAYYRSEADSLETAQQNKLDHILTKLHLQPAERFLDIGCGWGTLVMRAAQKYGALATGITLSKNQFESANRSIRRAGLQGRCQVLLLDYRDLKESACYDKIASVGMFEHVGLAQLRLYFDTVRRLLKPQGLVLNHGITSSDVANRWVGRGAGVFIDRYVFPDGELPHVSRVLQEMARAGLEVLDLESLRRHYARTCQAWSDNLEAHRLEAEGIAGARLCRIWRMYLAGCAHGFAHGWINLYQVLCSPAENSSVEQYPMTRDYMYSRQGEST